MGNKKKIHKTFASFAGILIVLCIISAGVGSCVFTEKEKPITPDILTEMRKEAWRLLENQETDSAAMIYAEMTGTYTGLERDSAMLYDYGVAMVNMGYIWLYKRNNPEQAFVWLERARAVGEENDLPLIKVGAYDNLGKIYADFRCFDQAATLYRDAMNESFEADFEWGVAMSFIDLLNLFLTRGDIKLIEEDIKKVDDFPFSDQELSQYCSIIASGLKKWVDGDPEKGAEIIMDADLHVGNLMDNERYGISQKFALGEALIAAGNTKEGIRILSEAKELAEKDSIYDLIEIAYELLDQAYTASSNPDSAAIFSQKALLIRDTLYNASNLDKIRDLEIASVYDNLGKKVAVEQSRAKQMVQVIWVFVIAGIVVLGFTVWLIVNYRKVRKTNRELYKRNVELANINSRQPVNPLARASQSESPPEDNNKNDRSPEKRDIGEEAKNIMLSSDEIYSPDFTIERLAEIMGVKPRTLGEAFIESTGKTFKAWLTETRVREACRLFADSDVAKKYSIEGVSKIVGYRSRTHFSRVFKEVTGMNASEFVRHSHVLNRS